MLGLFNSPAGGRDLIPNSHLPSSRRLTWTKQKWVWQVLPALAPGHGLNIKGETTVRAYVWLREPVWARSKGIRSVGQRQEVHEVGGLILMVHEDLYRRELIIAPFSMEYHD